MKFEIDYKAVGERVKEVRMSRKITQDTLAELIEVNPSFISNIERGKTKMSTETLTSIARNLNTSVDYFLFGDLELNYNQYLNLAMLEMKEILKDINKNELDAFLSLSKEFAKFIKRVSKQ